MLIILRRDNIGYNGLIIGLTASADEIEIKHFKDCGVDIILTKPLNIYELSCILRNYRYNDS